MPSALPLLTNKFDHSQYTDFYYEYLLLVYITKMKYGDSNNTKPITAREIRILPVKQLENP